MNIEVKEVEDCKLNITYTVDAGEIFKKRGEVMDQFKNAPVPGFRAGKATPDAIRMHYRNQIEDALKRSLAEDAFHNTIFEKKLKAFGAPKFNNLLFADGKFTCEFVVHIKPNFELPQYSNLEIPKPHETKSAINLGEEMMQELRMRFGEVIPFTENDFVQKTDNVIVDYEGSIDGVKNDNISASGEMISIGKSSLHEFDDNLLGMKVGETREFDLIVPPTGLPSIAGKTIHFKVTVNMGSKTTPCALDDELAKKMEKKDYHELREFIHNLAAERIAASLKLAITEKAASIILENTEMKVPHWMTLSEAQYLAHSSQLDWNNLTDDDKEKYLVMAEKNVKLALILDRIREIEPEAQLTDQEIFDIIKNKLSKTKSTTSIDDIIKEMNRTGYLQILFSRIKDEYTLDFITKTVRVLE